MCVCDYIMRKRKKEGFPRRRGDIMETAKSQVRKKKEGWSVMAWPSRKVGKGQNGQFKSMRKQRCDLG